VDLSSVDLYNHKSDSHLIIFDWKRHTYKYSSALEIVKNLFLSERQNTFDFFSLNSDIMVKSVD